MSQRESKEVPTVGFLTVVNIDGLGRIGGLLILNPRGRPLEFHCTRPVKTNRAQEILYGPTLDAFLHGENIARKLLERASTSPSVVCTDEASVLAVHAFQKRPILYVTDAPQAVRRQASAPTPDASPVFRVDRWDGTLSPFTLDDQTVWIPTQDWERRALAESFWEKHRPGFELAEPFSRIHEALDEAQRGMAA
ncbi:MAG: hypothetical protein KDA60_19340 [Planctomycetales bacterium]|nr:hypothetical protein [Planctomycetales bacterium]